MKPGDIVRVRENASQGIYNQYWIAEHGWLWVVTRIKLNDHTGITGIYTKSLATGAEEDIRGIKIFWYASELEKANV